MTIETDGSVSGEDAVAYAARILQDQLAIFVNFDEPQKEVAALRPCHVMRQERGIGVAEVERAGRRRCEAGYESHSVNACFARSV